MARLPQGVRKRNDGTLEKRFSIKGVRYSVYAGNTKELAQKEIELRKKIESGIYYDNRNITLDEYFKYWTGRKRNTIKSNTLRNYSCNYNKHISPQLGKRKVQDLERREIIRLQDAVSEKVSVYTSNYVIKIIKMILEDACIDEIISRNPAKGIKAIKDKSEKATDTIHRALTRSEQKVFMQELESDYYYEFLAFLLCSGMRTGELAALKWTDIDTWNNQIHITKTITYSENGEVVIGDSAKTEAGNRDIPLTSTLKGILKRWKDKIKNVFSLDGTIFVTPNGSYVYSNAINRAIEDCLQRLEEKNIIIERFTAHCLRDCYATRYIEDGGSLQTLKTILGHSSLAMTADLYSHVLPNTKQEEAEKVSFDIAL